MTASTTSAANAARNVFTSATATCPAGKVLLGGGARVTTTSTAERAQLVSSYASGAASWTATGVVAITALGAGLTMTVTAQAVCTV